MIGVSPVYLADTLRRIEARRAQAAPPKPAPKERLKLTIVGYYGTIDQVDGVDRRPRGVDPHAVDNAISGIVQDYLAPAENEYEDATFGNERLLRGIPAVGRVSGTMHRTDPLREVLR